MMKSLSLVLFAVSCISSSRGATLSRRLLANCRDVTFTVSGTAVGRKLTDPPDALAADAITGAYFTQPVVPNTISGTQKIYGQYCESRLSLLRTNTLAVLAHGLTYDHTYWNAFKSEPVDGDTNSMASYLISKGFSILSIDKLGSGQSDHPDPVNVVQIPYERELYHNLITQLRGNARLPVPNNWQKVIWVGHSMGSMIGATIAAVYPNDFDALILTGVAKRRPGQSEAGIFQDNFVQAATYDPNRFPPQTYTKGYYVTSSKPGRQASFYSQPFTDFLSFIFDLDFNKKDAVAIGEILTEQLITATAYTNPLYVSTGREDAVFCGGGSRTLGVPDCEAGPGGSQIAAFKDYFPAVPASKFQYYAQPNAGHAHQLHFSALNSFINLIQFLFDQGMR